MKSQKIILYSPLLTLKLQKPRHLQTQIHTHTYLLSRYNIYNNPDKYNFRFVWLLPAWVVNKWPNVGSKFQPISKYINNCIILRDWKITFQRKIFLVGERKEKEKNSGKFYLTQHRFIECFEYLVYRS